jgi:hypothetical protein
MPVSFDQLIEPVISYRNEFKGNFNDYLKETESGPIEITSYSKAPKQRQSSKEFLKRNLEWV